MRWRDSRSGLCKSQTTGGFPKHFQCMQSSSISRRSRVISSPSPSFPGSPSFAVCSGDRLARCRLARRRAPSAECTVAALAGGRDGFVGHDVPRRPPVPSHGRLPPEMRRNPSISAIAADGRVRRSVCASGTVHHYYKSTGSHLLLVVSRVLLRDAEPNQLGHIGRCSPGLKRSCCPLARGRIPGRDRARPY